MSQSGLKVGTQPTRDGAKISFLYVTLVDTDSRQRAL